MEKQINDLLEFLSPTEATVLTEGRARAILVRSFEFKTKQGEQIQDLLFVFEGNPGYPVMLYFQKQFMVGSHLNWRPSKVLFGRNLEYFSYRMVTQNLTLTDQFMVFFKEIEYGPLVKN